MTKAERLSRLLRGAPQGEILFHPILMHFAARFAGKTYRQFATDYRVLVESNVACLERFDHDAVSVISDPYRETAAFGAEIAFPDDSVPQCHAATVRTSGDVQALPRPNVYASPRTRDRIQGVAYYRQLLGGAVPIIGWIEGPLAEACDLAGVNQVLLRLAMEPHFVQRLMAKCLVTAKDFAQAQIEAGSQVMGVGDAICSQISLAMYRQFVLPLHQELFAWIHDLGAAVKLHICGDITHLLPVLVEAGADILDLDWMVDMAGVLTQPSPSGRGRLDEGTLHPHTQPSPSGNGQMGAPVLCGNLDPVHVIQELGADDILQRAKTLILSLADIPFILSGGCEIIVNTPPENLDAMRQAATSTHYS